MKKKLNIFFTNNESMKFQKEKLAKNTVLWYNKLIKK